MEEHLPKLLLGAGGLLQFMRANGKINDWWYGGSAIASCVVLWALIHGVPGDRADIVTLLAWLVDPTTLPVVLGGTFLVSKTANVVAMIPNVNASNPLVPVTNSK
jgi:hypothetical protein